MTSCKDFILSKTYTGTAKLKRVLELECQVEGFSAKQIEEAWKQLFETGYIYESDKWRFIKKT